MADDLIRKSDVLETYADLYDIFDDNKAIQEELHKVFDKINNIPVVESSSLEIPNNCDTCRFELYCPEMCEGCCEWDSHYEPKDESQTKLCRECDDYAGDGMYCASNHIVYDFSTSKENCELQTKQQTKRPWGMYIIEHPMYE